MTKHSYKLLYASKRGRAEPIRLIFHYHQVDFEDHIFEQGDWLKKKSMTPTGQMPYLEIDGGGLTLGQTVAICRYLAKGLDPESYFGGSTKPEAARCDMYADTFTDLLNQAAYVKYLPSEASKFIKEHFSTHCKTVLPILNEQIKKTGMYLCGHKILWCDLYAVAILSLIEEYVGDLVVPLLQEQKNLVEYYHRMRNTPKLRHYIDENWPEALVKFD